MENKAKALSIYPNAPIKGQKTVALKQINPHVSII